MKEKISIYYDEEGDFLEISIGNSKNCHFVEVEPGVAEKFDNKTGKFAGIAIHSLRARTKGSKEIEIPLFDSKIDIETRKLIAKKVRF